MITINCSTTQLHTVSAKQPDSIDMDKKTHGMLPAHQSLICPATIQCNMHFLFSYACHLP